MRIDAVHLSNFDAWTVISTAGVATILMIYRKTRGVEHRVRQWLDDALNVGTIIVLGALVFSSFPWWPLTIAASPLTDIALLYCVGVILSAMHQSVLKTKV